MDNRLEVSVIICCHNSSERIEETLTHVFLQSKKPKDIIIVDNNCTDDTAQKALQIAEYNSRTITIVEETKPGLMNARIAGVKAATGNLICFVEQGDSDTPGHRLHRAQGYGEGEWKMRKHGKEKRRVWRKLHLAVDAATHAIVAAESSLENIADNEVLPTLLNLLRREIEQVSGDGAYDTRECHALLKKKGIKATIPPRKNAALWEEGHPRNEAVEALKAGELAEWKKQSGYHQRLKAETAMYRYKQLISPKLSLRNHNAQVGEMLAGVKVLNKVIGLGMPVRQPLN